LHWVLLAKSAKNGRLKLSHRFSFIGVLCILIFAMTTMRKNAIQLSSISGTVRTGEAAAVTEATLFNGIPLIIGVASICTFYVSVRIYEQVFGWYAGLDSFAPEFTTYWMTILYIEEPVELISFLAIVGWMWKTRDKDVANVAPREEMRRIFNLMAWILIYGVAIYWGASYFTEQDGTWHMTVIRDTDFTPSHIIEFYMSYPMYIVVGVGGFMYARTRLPTFACKGWSVAYVLLFVGPFMIFPNVGLNEWGHTFWFMEELFVAPLHWMFVFFGWFSLAVFGVTLQILGRFTELCANEENLFATESPKQGDAHRRVAPRTKAMAPAHTDRAIEIASAVIVSVTIIGLVVGILFPGKVTGAILPVALILWYGLYKIIEQK
jgi:methane/ammonia monooxygenase subunit C